MENDAAPVENRASNEASVRDHISPREHIAQIFDDVRILAYAELSYYKARIAYARTVAKWTGLFASLSMFALFGAVVALILGLLLVLAQVVGPLAATICITAGFLSVGMFFGFLAFRNSQKFYFPEVTGESNDEER
jgi:ABC-type multidrug transport system fused ATPase/permease subunit